MNTATDRARELLLQRPALIDGRAAALRVLSRRHKSPPEQVTWRLAELRVGLSIEEMFKNLLPAEYAKLSSRRSIPEAFCRALGFEIEIDNMMQAVEEGVNPMDYSIPILAQNPVVEDDYYDPSDLNLVWRVALAINRPPRGWLLSDATDLLWDSIKAETKVADLLRPLGGVKREVLDAVFGATRSPLKHILVAMRVTEYDTGCVFFDYNPYEMGDPEIAWNLENIKWLRAQWKVGLQISRDLSKLWKWMTAKPAERVARIFRLYQQAQKLSNAKATNEPDQERALVRIL